MAVCMVSASKGDVTELDKTITDDPTLVNTACGSHGFTPLMLACEYGHRDAAALLLKRGADVNATRKQGGETALHLAAARGHPAVVSLLLRWGADPFVECTNPKDFTPLMAAANNGHLEVVRAMMQGEKEKVGMEDRAWRDREKAMWLAAGAGKAEVLRVLLMGGGTDWRRRDGKGKTIEEFARARAQPGVVEVLQWYKGEQRRLYRLWKARQTVDDTETILQAPSKVNATNMCEAYCAQVEAAPEYLRGRVERGQLMPVVVMEEGGGGGDGGGDGGSGRKRGREEVEEGEVVRAVVQHAVMGMKADPFGVLVEMMKMPLAKPPPPAPGGGGGGDGGVMQVPGFI